MILASFIWNPPRDLVDQANVTELIESMGFKSYKDFVKRSIEDVRWFWSLAPEILEIEWFKPYEEVLDISRGVEWAEWYVGGRINASYNVVDRIVRKGYGSKTAVIWIGEDNSIRSMTYSELEDSVKRFSSYLLESGVRVGDVVAIYAPIIPESIVAMLASIRIGAIASPIFSGFSPQAVASRLRISNSKILVTVDGYYRRGREVELKKQADEALRLSGVDARVVVIRRTGSEIPWIDGRDVFYHEIMRRYGRSDYIAEMNPNDPALLLFTSGTMGSPKGAVISHIGSIIKPGLEHFINLDMKSEDRLWWITDLGWMMGPWQVLGSQLLGASNLSIEGAIDTPPDRVWRIIEEHRVTHLGFAATAARILKSLGVENVRRHDISSLRVFGNTGEPIDPDTWMWIMRDVGDLERPMINLSGGTEVFGCILLPSVVVSLKPSTLWGPAPGVDADVFNESGESVREGVGYLVVKKPFPSMTRGLWRDPERYIESYWSRFKGVWYHGDWVQIDSDGYWYILGRADDVIKVSGMRVGAAELEGILNKHAYVAESACVGVPHAIRGEVIYCFVRLRSREYYEKASELEVELKNLISSELSRVFTPEKIIFVEDLPRTRSGKIMRRTLRSVVLGGEMGDITTLENPESIESIKRVLERMKII